MSATGYPNDLIAGPFWHPDCRVARQQWFDQLRHIGKHIVALLFEAVDFCVVIDAIVGLDYLGRPDVIQARAKTRALTTA
jgi:hypothetical protein